jgi:tRNA A-37 threonylcarbamoyl transferase component Bud32
VDIQLKHEGNPMIGKTVAHYEITEKLGEGGMGVVYKARDVKLDRNVALKFLPTHLGDNPEQNIRFLHEAQAASSLDHPNVCTVFDISTTDDDRLYICMAYYEGATLREKLKGDTIPADEALDIAVQIARGLSRAHEAGITHRDVKPANIIVTPRNEVKIVDFGVAKLAQGTGLTRTGTTVGTVSYMSPEQARGEMVDYRTDIWALGVILYQMFAGELPFKGDFENAVVYFILNEDPTPIQELQPDVPDELVRIVDRAMKKNVNDRYQSMDEILADLESARGQTPTAIVAARGGGRPRRRWPVAAGSILVFAVMAVAATWWLAKPGGAETGRPEAENARAMLAQTEQEVVQRDVRGLAPGEIRTAREIQEDAERSFQSGDYDTAQLLFDRSRAIYERVLAAAAVSQSTADEVASDAAAQSDAVKKPSDKQTPPPLVAVSAPPSERTSPTDAAARDRLLRLEDARSAAVAAEASVYAQTEYNEAEARAASGLRQMESGDYASAEAAFLGAESGFRATAAAAETQKRQIMDQVAQLRDRVETRRKELDSHRSMELYTQAIEFEREARDMESGDPIGALAAYQKSLDRLESAAEMRIRDDREIRALIVAYENALEGEDITRMTSLYDSLSRNDEETWRNFFGAVNDLDADMLVEEIAFDGDRATIDVSVKLLYAGASGSDSPHRWRVDATRTGERWKISHINRGVSSR